MTIDVERDLPIKGLVPKPHEVGRFQDLRVEPDMGPAYTYRLLLERSWSQVDVPSVARVPRSDQFDAIGLFSPFSPPYPPVLLSIGVRLAPPGSSVAEALRSYCQNEAIEVLHARVQRYASKPVLECLAHKHDPTFGDLTLRLAMFSDGGRLFGLSAMAPGSIYLDFVRSLSLAMFSFELLQPHE